MATFVPFANRTGPFQQVLPTNLPVTRVLSGVGSPEGIVPGVVGTLYLNVTANLSGRYDLYQKMGGNQMLGWVKVGESASATVPTGGTVSVVFAPVDPNGVQTCEGLGFAIGVGNESGRFWVKSTPGVSDSEWTAIIQ